VEEKSSVVPVYKTVIYPTIAKCQNTQSSQSWTPSRTRKIQGGAAALALNRRRVCYAISSCRRSAIVHAQTA